MKEAIEKMRYLLQSVAEKDDHESVEVSVKVIRELAEALAEGDTHQRVRESLEEDVVELQTQRNILVQTQDSLYRELKVYKTEHRYAQAKLNALHRAASKVREALHEFDRHERVESVAPVPPGDAA